MTHRTTLLRFTRLTLYAAIILNGIFCLAIALGLGVSLVWGDHFTALLLSPESLSGITKTTTGTRCLMLVGLLSAGATQFILHVLKRMAEPLNSDDPFVAANAARLRAIGWALVGLQVLDFPMMAIRHNFPGLGNAVPDTGLSLGGWLAVLLVFVLARIFDNGTAMRDYLQETI